MASRKGRILSEQGKANIRAALQRPEVRRKMSAAAKGRRHSAAQRANIAAALQGHPVGEDTRARIGTANRGKTRTPEQRAAMSAALKQRWADPAYRARMQHAHQGHVPASAGKPASEATRRKLSVAHTGRKRTIASRLKQGRSISGEHHWAWKGGPVPSNHRGIGWHVVKRLVRERAGQRCEGCGGRNIRNWQLDVHHIVPYRIAGLSTVDGCLALCRSCHAKAERGALSLPPR